MQSIFEVSGTITGPAGSRVVKETLFVGDSDCTNNNVVITIPITASCATVGFIDPNFSASITASFLSSSNALQLLSSSVTASFLSMSNALSFTSASLRQTIFNLSSSVTASFASFASSITSSFLSASNSITVTSQSMNSSFVSMSNSLTLTSQSINNSIVSASTVINNLRSPQYVVMVASTELPNDRVLAVTDPITRTDGGAGGNVTIALSSAFSSSLSNLSASLTNALTASFMGRSFGDTPSTATVPRPMTAVEAGQTIRYGSLTFTSLAPGTYNNYPISSSLTELFITPNPATGDVEFTGFAVTGSINQGFQFMLMKEGFLGRVILKDNSTSATTNRIFTPGGGPDYILEGFNDAVMLRWSGTVWHPIAVRRSGVQINSLTTGSFFPITNFIGSTGINETLTPDFANHRQDVTLSIDNNVVATVSGTTFTGGVTARGGLTGSMFTTPAGLSYIVAGSGISVTSASNGQVTIAQSSIPTNMVMATLANTASLNSTTNLQMCQYIIPANSLVASSTFELKGFATHTHAGGGATPDIIVDLVHGSTVLKTLTIDVPTTNQPWPIKCEGTFKCRTTGGSGTAMTTLFVTAPRAADFTNAVSGSVITSTDTIDTTTAQPLTMRIRMSALGASNSLTVVDGYIVKIF